MNIFEQEQEKKMSDLHRKLAGRSIPRGLPPRPQLGVGMRGRGGRSRGGGQFGKKSYTGVSWRKYWHSKQFVDTETGTFCVYQGGSRDSDVSLCLLHGAGYSALTWSVMVESLTSLADCRVLAIDLRGHGETRIKDEEPGVDLDLSGDTMARDVGQVISHVYDGLDVGVVLMGHSMGGALASLVASQGLPGLLGLVVEDVVEGTAMEALAGMHSVLQSRPRQFQSLEQAVEWCVRSGQVRNLESARVSMPGQVVTDSGLLGAKVVEDKMEDAENDANTNQAPAKREKIETTNSIKEEDEENENGEIDKFKVPSVPESLPTVDKTPPETFTGPQVYKWRIDLSRTEPHWSGWFQGLSQRFLTSPGAKMLLLAGVDRLDKELTVGQMQGKFQMQVLPQVFIRI